MAQILTDQNFTTEVIKSKLPVVVDFWAPWCGPCRMVSPIIEELAEEFEGKVKIGKLNVDENPKSAETYRVLGIPTIMIFRSGVPVRTMVGVQNPDYFRQEINRLLEVKHD